MWGVQADEAVGKNFFALDIGFPVEQLRSELATSIVEPKHLLIKDAINRRGQKICCRVTIMNLPKDKGKIVMIDEVR